MFQFGFQFHQWQTRTKKISQFPDSTFRVQSDVNVDAKVSLFLIELFLNTFYQLFAFLRNGQRFIFFHLSRDAEGAEEQMAEIQLIETQQ